LKYYDFSSPVKIAAEAIGQNLSEELKTWDSRELSDVVGHLIYNDINVYYDVQNHDLTTTTIEKDYISLELYQMC
jgi:hypothetical protein